MIPPISLDSHNLDEFEFAKRKKRLKYFNDLSIDFLQLYRSDPGNPKIYLIDNFHKVLNDFYWHLFDERIAYYVHNHKETRVNRYKISSGMEISIMRVLPFRTNDEKLIKKINANFAFAVSKVTLQNWGRFKINSCISEFNDEHLIWLENLDTYSEIPIFSNAQTLRLYDDLLQITNRVCNTPIQEAGEQMRIVREILKDKGYSLTVSNN